MRTARLIVLMLVGAVATPIAQAFLEAWLWPSRWDGVYRPPELIHLTWAVVGAVGGLIVELCWRWASAK